MHQLHQQPLSELPELVLAGRTELQLRHVVSYHRQRGLIGPLIPASTLMFLSRFLPDS